MFEVAATIIRASSAFISTYSDNSNPYLTAKTVSGTASHLLIEFKDLPELLIKMTDSEALSSAAFTEPDVVDCFVNAGVIDKRVGAEKDRFCINAIAKGDSFLSHDDFAPGISGIVILDVVASKTGQLLSQSDFYEMLCLIIPNFKSVSCFGYSSTSEFLPGLSEKGYQVLFPIQQAVSISAFREWLFYKLWLLKEKEALKDSYRWIKTNQIGDLIDWSILGVRTKLAYKLECFGYADSEIKWHQDSVGILDFSSLKKIEKKEQVKVDNLILKEKRKLRGDALKIKKSRLESDVNNLAKLKELHPGLLSGLNAEREFEFSQADRINKHYVVNLHSASVLCFKDRGNISVFELLKNANKVRYKNHVLADPIEGEDSPAGKNAAIFFSGAEGNKGRGLIDTLQGNVETTDNYTKPMIYSRAQGGIIYYLKHPVRDNPVKHELLPINDALENSTKEMNAFFHEVHKLKETYAFRTDGLFLTSVKGNFNRTIKVTPGLNVIDSLFTAIKETGHSLLIHLYVSGEELTHLKSKDYAGEVACWREGAVIQNSILVDSIDEPAWERIDQGVMVLPHQYLNTILDENEKTPDAVIISGAYSDVITGYYPHKANKLKSILSKAGVRTLQEVIDIEPINNSDFKTLWGNKLKYDFNIDLEIEQKKLVSFIKKYEGKRQSNNAIITGEGDESYLNDNKYGYQFAWQLTKILKNPGEDSYFSCLNKTFYIHRTLMTAVSRDKSEYTHMVDRVTKYKDRYTHFLMNNPILCLDAYADEKIANRLLNRSFNDNTNEPEEIKFIEVNAIRNLCVTQCNSRTFSKRSLLAEGLSSLRSSVAMVINRTAKSNYAVYGEKTLLVTYQVLTEDSKFVGLLDNISAVEGTDASDEGYLQLIHFNEVRGASRHKKSHLIILGRNEPSVNESMLTSESLFKDFIKYQHKSNLQQGFEETTKAAYQAGLGIDIQKAKGSGRYFNYEPINCTLYQSRENRSHQAIAMLQDVYSKTHKQVLILSSLALDLKIDRVVTWPELNVKDQQLDIMRFYADHDGIFIQAPAVLNHLDSKCSREQWKNRVKENNEQYVLPMSEDDISQCKKLSESSDSGDQINFNQHLFPEIKHLEGIKVSGQRNKYKVSYDSKRQSEESVIAWVEKVMEN